MTKAWLEQKFLLPSFSSRGSSTEEGWKSKLELLSQTSELRRGVERPGTGRVGEWVGDQKAGRTTWQLARISAAAVHELGTAGSRRALWIQSGSHLVHNACTAPQMSCHSYTAAGILSLLDYIRLQFESQKKSLDFFSKAFRKAKGLRIHTEN